MEFEVRPAVAEDVTHVMDIDVKSFDLPWSSEEWHRPQLSIGVATLQKTPIGVAVFQIVRFKEDCYVEFHKLAVRPNFRGRKVSLQLFEDVMHCARYSGATHIETIVPENLCLPGNPQDISGWLTRVGFRATGVKRGHFQLYGQPEDGYEFRINQL